MISKDKTIEFNFFWIILLCGVILRVATYMFARIRGADSFYFLNYYNLRDVNTVIGYHFGIEYMPFVLLGILILTWVLFYSILKEMIDSKLIRLTIFGFLVVSPITFVYTYIGNLDRGMLELFLFTLIIYLNIKNWRITSIIVTLIGYFFVWPGFLIITMILLSAEFIYQVVLKKKYFYGILGLPLSYLIVTFFPKYSVYMSENMSIIAELQPLWHGGLIIELLFYFFILAAIAGNLRDLKERKYFILSAWFCSSFIAAIFIQRMFVLTLIPMFILLGISLAKIKETKKGTYIAIGLMAFFVFASLPVYTYKSYNVNEITEVMEYIDTLPTTCILSMWDSGHLYNYYSNKTILYEASPPKNMDQIYNYLVYGTYNNKLAECTILLCKRDIKGLNNTGIMLYNHTLTGTDWIYNQNVYILQDCIII